MRYKIFKDGEQVNTIVADEDFCASYCEENGYTYEPGPMPEPESTHEPEKEPTAEEILDAMLGVSRYE